MFIEWDAKGAKHIATRSQRYGPDADDLDIAWTQEAVNDLRAVVSPVDPDEPYLRVITGYSASYGGRITVVYLDIGGQRIGVTAYPTS